MCSHADLPEVVEQGLSRSGVAQRGGLGESRGADPREAVTVDEHGSARASAWLQLVEQVVASRGQRPPDVEDVLVVGVIPSESPQAGSKMCHRSMQL